MKSRSIVLEGPKCPRIAEAEVPAPGPGEVRVRTLSSGVSAGTEMLYYRGRLDSEHLSYPSPIGYANVGTVVDLGSGVESEWMGRQVFALQPHTTGYSASAHTLTPLSGDVAPEQATFLANLETAVSLVMDGRPMIGERVAVVGQGVVGILTSSLLSRMALDRLVVVDPIESRRGAAESVCAVAPETHAPESAPKDFDLVFELSGSGEGLEVALGMLGYSGRLVLGSWYGSEAVQVHLGRLHRGHNRVIMSQVSQVDPEHAGRFDKSRRMTVATTWLERLDLEPLISHRVQLEEAPAMYELIDETPERCLHVVITYPEKS